MNSKISTILKQQGLFIGLGMLNPLVSFLLIPIHIKYFSPAEYGLLYLLYTIASLSAIIASFNLNASLKTFYFDFDGAGAKDFTHKLVKYMMVIGSIYLVLVYLFGPFIVNQLFDKSKLDFSHLIPLSIVAFLLRNLVNSYQIYLRNARKNKLISQLTVLNALLFCGLQLILIIYFEQGIESIFYAMIISSVSALLLVFVNEKGFFKGVVMPIAKPIKYGINLMPLFLMEWLIIRGDRFFVQDRFDLSLLGQYALAMNIALLLSFVTSSFLNAARPELYQSFKQIKKGNSKDFVMLYFLFLGVLLMAAVGVYILSMILPFISTEGKYLAIKSILPLTLLIILIRSHNRFVYEYYECFKKSTPIIYFTAINFVSFLVMIYFAPLELELRGILYSLIASNLLCLLAAIGYTLMNKKGIRDSL